MNTYTKKEKMRYLLGLSGQNIIYGIITSSFAYYLQFTVLIPAVWVGIILSVSRIFDAVKDPIIGSLIEKSNRGFKRYLLFTPVPTAILTVLCFFQKIYSPQNGNAQNAVIIAGSFLCYLLWETVFTIGDIPLTAYPHVLTQKKDDRTQLLSLRPIGAVACSITALIFQPIAFFVAGSLNGSVQENERNAFLITAAVFSIAGGLLFQFTAVGSKEKETARSEKTQSLFKYLKTNPLLRKITVSGILGSLKSVTGLVMTPLVAYYFSGKNSALTLIYTALLGAGSFVGLIAAMLTVPKLTAKYKAKTVYTAVNLLGIIPNVLIFLLYLKYPQDMTALPQTALLFILTLAAGSFMSISATVQTLIISEAVDLEEKISGNKPAVLFFSVQTFLVKIASGLSSLFQSASYAAINFSSAEAEALNAYIAGGGIPRLESEYSFFLLALFFLFTIPAALSSLLCVLPFLKREKVNEG